MSYASFTDAIGLGGTVGSHYAPTANNPNVMNGAQISYVQAMYALDPMAILGTPAGDRALGRAAAAQDVTSRRGGPPGVRPSDDNSIGQLGVQTITVTATRDDQNWGEFNFTFDQRQGLFVAAIAGNCAVEGAVISEARPQAIPPK